MLTHVKNKGVITDHVVKKILVTGGYEKFENIFFNLKHPHF